MQLAEERRQTILDAVEREGRVLATELAQRLDTSDDTVRRDLRELDAAGLLRRVHGGAVRRTRSASFGERIDADVARKAALAQALRDCIRPGDTVLVDAGSTNLAVARLLEDGQAAAIVTNSPQLALALGDLRSTRIVLLGGTYHAACGAVLGARTLADLQQLRADLCIVGICALDPERGLAASDAEEAAIKAAMLAGSTRRAAAVLNERLVDSAPFAFGALAELDYLVLEADAPPATIARLREAHPALELRIAAKART
ncbi:DeoR/GlpR family DNA-binding transcription regulator [Massilia yuzhufengensis]|uniref:Transcriptional regulator, DeoR family n=1 Tax=Massilia yuzhufengensis TaxID=1164594 RepID=A0A1I1RH63_9BURK|nr:DeoR/GlpR family DNA-binding transcription regulator [Massilia yuzhufengensis]SFD33665.1 transcriptional regulator, DeoR family [Massilia yuzhufengensis]